MDKYMLSPKIKNSLPPIKGRIYAYNLMRYDFILLCVKFSQIYNSKKKPVIFIPHKDVSFLDKQDKQVIIIMSKEDWVQ